MSQQHDLVGLSEISDMFGVPKSTASSWTRQHSFPAYVLSLKAGTFWERADVLAWRAPKAADPFASTCPTCGSTLAVAP